jgi:hypothetical protein
LRRRVMKHITKVVLDDEGNQCIEFSDELMLVLDLQVGNVLQWDLSEDNRWTLTKIKDTEENE